MMMMMMMITVMVKMMVMMTMILTTTKTTMSFISLHGHKRELQRHCKSKSKQENTHPRQDYNHATRNVNLYQVINRSSLEVQFHFQA